MKCNSGHYGELLARDKHHKIDILLSPMVYSLPSYLNGHVMASLSCPRVMAAPENIKAGFLKEKDVFAEHGVRFIAPMASLGDAPIVPKQLFEGLRDHLHAGLLVAEERMAGRRAAAPGAQQQHENSFYKRGQPDGAAAFFFSMMLAEYFLR